MISKSAKIFFVFLFIFLNLLAADDPKFVGAGSCASSGCHGSAAPRSNRSINQNEYSLWIESDSHSRAYEVLSSEWGMAIGRALELEPSKDKKCLVCHTTFVKEAKLHGLKYRVEEGVSCETCHGAAEFYLKSHSREGASPADNLAKGLVNLKSARAQAALCLDCHEGASSSQVTHELYAAGHPRLSFELESFLAAQPAHFRKWPHSKLDGWYRAQIMRAERMLAKMSEYSMANSGKGLLKTPELSLLTCYECHHRFQDQRWKTHTFSKPLGELKFNLSSLWMLAWTLQFVSKDLGDELTESLGEIEKSSALSNVTELGVLLKRADSIKPEMIKNLQLSEFSNHLLAQVGGLQSISYETAEQVAMFLSLVSDEVKSDQRLLRLVDALYLCLKDPAAFKAMEFLLSCRKFMLSK